MMPSTEKNCFIFFFLNKTTSLHPQLICNQYDQSEMICNNLHVKSTWIGRASMKFDRLIAIHESKNELFLTDLKTYSRETMNFRPSESNGDICLHGDMNR